MARRRTQSSSDAALKQLRAFGLAYPGTHTKSPWPGHLDLAVNDKTFAYLSIEGEPFSISCKLPRSSAIALMLPFVKPTAYGLGKSGWVSASPDPEEPIPVDLFKEWIDESYRAQAPKKLVAQLDIAPSPAAKKSTSARGAATASRERGTGRSVRRASTTSPGRGTARSARGASTTGTARSARGASTGSARSARGASAGVPAKKRPARR